MGKGVIPDSGNTSDTNVATARSQALKNADVIILLGARLNWILHYGASPRFNDQVKIIQVDISPEDLGDNRADPALAILGDVSLVCEQLARGLRDWKAPKLPPSLMVSSKRNIVRAQNLENNLTLPLKYQAVYGIIRDLLAPHEPLFISEGANTMDISRSSFLLQCPRSRLDAGTNATMGLGMGYAIAASLTHPERLIIGILGDSAFGFSAIEVETAVRCQLSMVIYIMNNSGVYHGVDKSLYIVPRVAVTAEQLPPIALSLETRYDTLAESLGANGRLVKTPKEIKNATQEAIEKGGVWVINVIIDNGQEKKLEFGWMNKSKM
ncbi:Thiamin diphosphate-binding protein [Nadsonia fulvescens var. elongata DSM 6958]|uniref:2-hydroxyacyl-CoA lyase n=1 Tax=Nadsonia fulvescens var. elongata DSM 6958 TaxID=857566 RepID=A0A1E3PEI5_9ASCO|nr:Thiamin diphosphate-binding protein [Nadsonia fulvescens var. elongata DSM 6958]